MNSINSEPQATETFDAGKLLAAGVSAAPVQCSNRAEPRWKLLLAVSLIFGFAAGCAVGPNYSRPAGPTTKDYTPSPIRGTVGTTNIHGGEEQRIISGGDIPGEWWALFHSKALNQAIELSLSNNPTLKAAQATLAQAMENVSAQKGAFFPAVSGSFSATRQRTSDELSPTPNSGALYFSLFTPQVSVSYVPDIFGLNRRTVESLQAQAQQARFALAATHLTLSANVAAAAIQEASLRSQIDATGQLLAINSNMLQLLTKEFARGYVGRLEVAAQESQLAQVAATLPPLLKQLAQQRDLIAALCGGFPDKNPVHPVEFADLQLPTELPLSLPSQLVEQRPDVRQAEESLHAACALVGVAAANRLPNLALTADAGTMALEAGKIFAGGAGFWTLAGNVTQPLFQGGTLRHRERAARAAYQAAAEQYRSTVLTAFQNVADTLHALEQDGHGLNSAAAARTAAEITLNLAKQQWQTGYAGYLAVLGAEQTYQQALLNLAQAQASRFADTVALFQALGGGWWNRRELATN